MCNSASLGHSLDAPPTSTRRVAWPTPVRSRYVCIAEVILWLSIVACLGACGAAIWFVATSSHDTPRDPFTFALYVSGLFATVASLLALHDIHLHLRHWVSPLQRYYVRILALIIVYAGESWLSLRFPSARTYLGILRGAYEAFALYTVLQLMLSFLGGRRCLALRLLANGQERSITLPCYRCCRPWRNGYCFVHRCCIGIYQYVLLRTLFSVIGLVCEACGRYREGSWDPAFFYMWTTVVMSASQFYCVNVLATLYINCCHLLRPLGPLAKVGIIKLLVFLLFWQGVVMAVASGVGLVKTFWSFPDEPTASAAIQNCAVCVELLLIALMMRRCYSYRDFWSEDGAQTPVMEMSSASKAFDAEMRTKEAEGLLAAAKQDDDDEGEEDFESHDAPPASPSSEMAVTREGDGAGAQLVSPSSQRPMSVFLALYEIMPFDVLAEGREFLLSGCGLHKRGKRMSMRHAVATLEMKPETAYLLPSRALGEPTSALIMPP